MRFTASAAILLLFLLPLDAQVRVGRRGDGAAVLPNGWAITPAGAQVPLSTLPMSIVPAPGENHALILQAGFLQPKLSVIDLSANREVSSEALADAWHGLTFNKSGDEVWVGGGSRGSVFRFDVADGRLTNRREHSALEERRRHESDLIGDVVLSADERLVYAANLMRNHVEMINAQTGVAVGGFSTGSRPYRMRLGVDGKTMWISHWGEATVGLYALDSPRLIEKTTVGGRPSDLVLIPGKFADDEDDEETADLVARLFVAVAEADSVFVLGLTAGNEARLIQSLSMSPYPNAPIGALPTALSYDAERKRLWVACSGNNSVVAVDVSGPRARLVGAAPTGWRPTAVAAVSDGRLLYLNAKGGGSHPAPRGPDPTRRGASSDYVAALQTGSLGILPALDEDTLAAAAPRVAENSPYDPALAEESGAPAGSPIPGRIGEASPIEHVIYVIKENRSYDQLFGDLKEGEGDPSLLVFGDDAAPNHRALAKRFVLFDNFYAVGDVSADGVAWAVSALASDFTEKLWPARYARRRAAWEYFPVDSAARPSAGAIWSNAISAGLRVRNYGLWTERKGSGAIEATDPSLEPHTDMSYAPFELARSDGERVDEFLADFREQLAAGTLPSLMTVYLPGDHTAGRAPGLPTARAMMAEHDYALGRLIEGVSKSPAWEKTTIFVVEDDAQDGADHVDSHRTVALVAGPYVRRGVVDSTLYSSLSVLRTIELILGLRPMTQFDAAATVMWRAFQAEPSDEPYEAVRPVQSFEEKNPEGSGGAPRRVDGTVPGESLAGAGSAGSSI